MSSAAREHMGGEVLTRTPSTCRMQIVRRITWRRNDAAPRSLRSIEPLPKLGPGQAANFDAAALFVRGYLRWVVVSAARRENDDPKAAVGKLGRVHCPYTGPRAAGSGT